MRKLNSIVVGIDYSPACDQALKEAERIARWNGSALTVVSVLDQSVLDSLHKEDPTAASRITSQFEVAAKEHVESVLGSLPEANFEFIAGHPFTEIQRRRNIASHNARRVAPEARPNGGKFRQIPTP